MLKKFLPLTHKQQRVFSQSTEWAQRNWIKIFGLVLIAYVLLHKDLDFQFNLKGTQNFTAYQTAALPFGEAVTTKLANTSFVPEPATVTHEKHNNKITKKEKKKTPVQKSNSKAPSKPKDDNLANTYSNMTYTFDKSVLKKSKTKGWKAKRKRQADYISRFAEVSQAEMKKYGIPASIILAQGLIETNAGDSRLAKQNNNHFGMKCFSKKCGKGHCSNFTDDTHKDFFRKYKSSWESYRAHSHLLNGKRYKHLKKLGTKNYKDWARGLKKAGYATDRRYAEKLINIIEELKLQQYDNE